MVGAVNGIIFYMMHLYPDFGLDGEMVAQGEDIKDRWRLTMVHNVACRFENDVDATGYVKCPECGHEFKPGEDK